MPAERAQRTWVAVRFASESEQTRLTLDHLGFGEGEGWARVHAYFERAWPRVLARMIGHFAESL
jgi:hypothetical protein